MPTKTRGTPLAEQQHIVLHDVSWGFYERLLREIGDRPLRVTYNNGSLEIMAPLASHEMWKTIIGRMIEILTLELNIPMLPLGSTTFKWKEVKKGLEPDECYYFQHADAVRGKERLDLAVDPPPDLAVEVDITRRSIKREPIYRALGVPELWRFRARRLTVLLLGPERTYLPSPSSAAFPFLPMATFEKFLLRLEHEEQTALLREFRDWTRTLSM
ncbi:MAG TPA: Uma2 family endonuclease [Tepidisphaeraceae bacterium]|jgi:Uma2 family endonuclease